MSELKPCPFCKTFAGFSVMPPYEDHTGYVRCNFCGAKTPFDTWNIRPIEDALNARIAELERDKKALRGIEENLREHIDIGTLQLSVATARIAELEAAQRWTPVSEPPKVDGSYLLRTVYSSDFIAKTETWVLRDYDSVTHWMPLPKLPEVQE